MADTTEESKDPEQPATRESIVATNVRQLRESAGLTQVELAERVSKTGCDLGEMAICNLENGRRRVRVDDLFALAKALDVSPRQLLSPDAQSATAPRTHEATLEGGVVATVVADAHEVHSAGWINFYLDGELVYFAATSRVIGVRIQREKS